MYTIFAKDKIVHLVHEKNSFVEDNHIQVIRYLSQEQLFREYKIFVEQSFIQKLCFLYADVELLWKKFQECFKLIEAAGGLVKNNRAELLLIFRLERWDLPKGKIEKGEQVKAAAIREVQEECGIQEIKISGEAPVTYHTYLLNGKHILKKTYWFEMNYTGSDYTLTPQLEENITDARWMNQEELKLALKNTYPLIREVLQSHIA